MTQTIVEVANPLGIAVHDHLIVARNGHASHCCRAAVMRAIDPMKFAVIIQESPPQAPARRTEFDTDRHQHGISLSIDNVLVTLDT